MKAKKVYENIGFQRDKDINKSLGIGKHREPKIGDKIMFSEQLTFMGNGKMKTTDYDLTLPYKFRTSSNPHFEIQIGDFHFYTQEILDQVEKWDYVNDIDERTYESMDFQRSKDITKALGIGKHRMPKDGDKIMFSKNLDIGSVGWIIVDEYDQWTKIHKDEILTIQIDEDTRIGGGDYTIVNRGKNGWSMDKIDLKRLGPYWHYVTNESMDFKRDKDSIKSLDIGDSRSEVKPYLENHMQYGSNGWYITVPKGFKGIDEEIDGNVVFASGNSGRETFNYMSHIDWVDDDRNYDEMPLLQVIDDWIDENFDELMSDWEGINKTNESMNFKRSCDITKSLDIGEDRSDSSVIRRFLKESEISDWAKEHTFEWLSDNVELMNKLGINDIDDLDDILTFDSESKTGDIEDDGIYNKYTDEHYYVRDNHESKHKSPAGNLLSFEVSKLYDGSKVIYYWAGLIDGFIARKEWLQ